MATFNDGYQADSDEDQIHKYFACYIILQLF